MILQQIYVSGIGRWFSALHLSSCFEDWADTYFFWPLYWYLAYE